MDYMQRVSYCESHAHCRMLAYKIIIVTLLAMASLVRLLNLSVVFLSTCVK